MLKGRLHLLAKAAFWGAFALASWFAIVPLPASELPGPSDKFLHMLAFSTLSLTGALAFARLSPWRFGAMLSAYGVLIEIVQSLPIVNRDAEVMDWVADTVAVAVTLGVVWAVRWVLARRG